MLGVGEIVDQRAREDVDQLDLRVADDEPASPPDGDRDLERQLDLGAARCRDPADPRHRLLHREAASTVARIPSSPSSQHVIASPEK